MRVLVTGGGGFLGQAIVRRLIARGDNVRTLQRSDSAELSRLGADCLCGDIADLSTVRDAVADCETVFHVAARAGVWGTSDEFYRANVIGSKNVLEACQSRKVRRLVYTSSPSVIFDGRDEAGIDETVPYPTRYLTHYPKTKAAAEQLILAANSPSLSTVSLRPHLIWGPGDNHLIPRLIQRAREGKLRRVGPGTNLVDTTYIDNAADAHLLASNALHPESAVAGRAYFISNGEPRPLWEFIDEILACAGLPAVTKRISATNAYLVGGLLELAFTVAGRRDEPPMTRFVARQLSTAHWFRLDAARRDFGYDPKVSIDEGLRRLAGSLKHDSMSRTDR
jgi:nucleoside-diphosphate-sugar epimerase